MDTADADLSEQVAGSERPTMSDVARAAGVSLKTVSRVVNGEPGVRPATSESVMAAVHRLGYRPNAIAAEFARSGSRREIGLVIDDVSNPFWARTARAIEDRCTASGRHIITASSDFEPEREHEIVDSFVRHRLGGLIIVPVARDHAYLAREIELGTAIVFLDRPQANLEADTVTLDDYGGARAAVEHLIGHGHRRIAALMQSMRIYTMRERCRGYRDALDDAGIDFDEALESHAETAEDAREATAHLLGLDDPPSALFCANNRMSVGAMSALGASGRRVAIVGFDDVELAEVLAVPLTVVRTDPEELGRIGAELLLRRMDGWDAPTQQIVLPTELVERGSGEIHPF